MRIPIYILMFLGTYIFCYADSIDNEVVMTDETSTHQDLEKGKKKVGKEVQVPHNKQLVAYNNINSLPRMNDFVAVPLSFTDAQGASRVKMIWGRVIGRNHYVFVVQISKNKGLYYTEYNMYALL